MVLTNYKGLNKSLKDLWKDLLSSQRKSVFQFSTSVLQFFISTMTVTSLGHFEFFSKKKKANSSFWFTLTLFYNLPSFLSIWGRCLITVAIETSIISIVMMQFHISSWRKSLWRDNWLIKFTALRNVFS